MMHRHKQSPKRKRGQRDERGGVGRISRPLVLRPLARSLARLPACAVVCACVRGRVQLTLPVRCRMSLASRAEARQSAEAGLEANGQARASERAAGAGRAERATGRRAEGKEDGDAANGRGGGRAERSRFEGAKAKHGTTFSTTTRERVGVRWVRRCAVPAQSPTRPLRKCGANRMVG